MINLRAISQKINFKIYLKGPKSIVSEIVDNYLGYPNYICVLPVHGFSLSFEMKQFHYALTNSLFIVPDGMPISLYASHKYGRIVERVYGPDLMINLLSSMNKLKQKNKIYLLGGNNNLIKKLTAEINYKFPNIRIVGYDSSFIDIEDNNYSILKKINSVSPDVVFVGYGCPKQEIWMNKNYNKINSLLIGVGAAFDFIAGTKKQAPKWMQNNYLEWLFRLMQEPRRLFWRYFKYNTIFVAHIFFRITITLINKIKHKLKL